MKQTTKSTLIGTVIGTIIGAAAGLSMLQRDQSQAIQEVSGEIRALREETTQIKQQVIEVEKAQKKNELTKEERAALRALQQQRVAKQLGTKTPKVVTYRTAPIKLSKSELDCLSRNVYYEAGVEDIHGKIAVAQVTLNRLESGQWGKHVCSVVKSSNQFSWTLTRVSAPKGVAWKEAQKVAKQVAAGLRLKKLENSLHYHAEYISSPHWAKVMTITHKIGQHIFYVKKV